MTDSTPVQQPATKPVNKGGRPRGYPRSGGRKKGVPNKGTIATREMILRKGNPIEFLIGVMNGNRFTAAPEEGSRKKSWAFPTMDQRLAAAQTLARKVAADMKSVDLSAEEGRAPFVFQFISGGQQ